MSPRIHGADARLPNHWPDAGSRPEGSQWLASLALACMLACAAAGAWLSLLAAPVADAVAALRDEGDRAHGMNDAIVVRSIAAGLAANDYGEVQDSLSLYQSTGIFGQAVVVNRAGQIVASVGGLAALRIGGVLPESLQQSGRTIEITGGTEKLGSLHVLKAIGRPAGLSGETERQLRIVALTIAALALLAAIVLAAHLRRQRHSSALQSINAATVLIEAPSTTARLDTPSSGFPNTAAREMEIEIRQRIADARQREADTRRKLAAARERRELDPGSRPDGVA